jgi:hypothetical protein
VASRGYSRKGVAPRTNPRDGTASSATVLVAEKVIKWLEVCLDVASRGYSRSGMARVAD